MRATTILLLVVIFTSCENKSDNTLSYYFDVDSLLTEQADLLLEKEVEISKRVTFADTSESTQFKPDKQQIEEEFSLLKSININKPIYFGIYNVEERSHPSSNLTIRRYVPDKDEKVDIPYLELTYLNSTEQLYAIEGEFFEKTSLTKSRRKIQIEFEDLGGQYLIKSYNIEGLQKLLGLDSVTYALDIALTHSK